MSDLTLPTARIPGRYVVELVCSGNICRSPAAHVVLEQLLIDAGLDDIVAVVSSGTGGWHVGEPMDSRTAATLDAAGYDATRHRARRFDVSGWGDVDVVLAMDAGHRSELARSQPPADGGDNESARLILFRSLDPVGTGQDVPDPYYGGPEGFEEVLDMVERTSAALIVALQAQRPWRRMTQGRR